MRRGPIQRKCDGMPRLYPARMTRMPRAESLLAWGAAATGVIGVVSALTPEMANRLDLVRGVLPPGVPAAARVLALSFGIALVWLSRSLVRRRRRAWQLGIVVVCVSAIAHMAKGLAFEEASASLLLLTALIRYRKRFDVPGDPLRVRPLALVGLAGAAALALPVGIELRGSEMPARLADAVTAVGLLLAFYVL